MRPVPSDHCIVGKSPEGSAWVGTVEAGPDRQFNARGWPCSQGYPAIEVVPLTVELRRRSMLDQAASSLVGVTAAMVWSSATRSAGRCR
jgi:hypothetical protein